MSDAAFPPPMATSPTMTRRTALIGVAGLVAGSTALAIPHSRDGDVPHHKLAALIPETIGRWHSHADDAIVLPDVEKTDLIYDKTFARSYAADGHPEVMLVIAHGGASTTSWTVHRPESCYAAAGFHVSELADVGWPVGGGVVLPGRTMATRRDDRVEQVGYWRRIAGEFPVTYHEERWIVLRRRLAGRVPDGVLVRMSSITGDAARTMIIGAGAGAVNVTSDVCAAAGSGCQRAPAMAVAKNLTRIIVIAISRSRRPPRANAARSANARYPACQNAALC